MTKEEQQKDDIETMKILFNADINELCNQRRFNDAREMEGIRDRIIKALEQQPNRCDSCIHSEERDGSNCYECIKGMSDNFEEHPKTSYISIDVTKFAKGVAEKALDEITYEGKTIREWAELLVKQQPCEDAISREVADVLVNILEKIRAEIEEYKSRQLTLAIGIDDLEKGKQIALEYVLAILDKYREGDNDAEH